jgi:pimeloyl-ACP methyl ester carboxylesterase
MPPEAKQTPDEKRDPKVLQMNMTEPHIDPKALETITAPTLVLAGDHDIIRDEHTLEIYHQLPNAELCIFPGATHAIPYDDPVLFNTIVDHFFQTPFVKKDRLNDLVKSMDALQKTE